MTMSIGGIISGLDTAGLIEQLMAIERRPITLMQQRQLTLESQRDAWRDVNTRLRNLQAKFSTLKLESTYLAKKTTSSDDKIITATATSQAGEGTYDIKVNQLATGQSQMSRKVDVDSGTALSKTGTISITGIAAGAAESRTWAIEVGQDDSLTAIAKKLNSAFLEDAEGKKTSAPVSASIVDGRLVLSSKGTGEKSAFSVQLTGTIKDGLLSDDPNSGTTEFHVLDQAKSAQNGSITVNGILIDGLESNTVTDAIQGITLNLQTEQASDDAPVRVKVQQDTQGVIKAMQAFVDQYNSTMDFIASKLDAGYSNTGKAAGSKGALSGDSTLVRLQASLRQMVTSRSSFTSGKYLTLSDIGVSTGKWNKDAPDLSGALSLDTAKLEEALKANPLAVKDILYKSTNVALNATASSSDSLASGNFPIESVTDGVVDPTNWGNGQGWSSSGLPATLTMAFGQEYSLDMLKLYTLDSKALGAADYGVSDYEVWYYDKGSGSMKKLLEVKDNTKGVVTNTLDGSFKTDKLEFRFTGSNDDACARVVEIEAYEDSGVLYNLEKFIASFTQYGTGILSEKEKSYNNQIEDIKDQIKRMEDRLEARQQSLVRQFTTMEQALSRMQNQGNWLMGQVAQLSNWNYSGNK